MNAYEQLAEFKYPKPLQDDAIDKMGTQFYFFRHISQKFTGYEDLANRIVSSASDESGWIGHKLYGQIMYGVKKSVVWKYGFDPESVTELNTGVFRSDSGVG